MSLTRICIKNLPKHLTEQRLRQHFEQKGEVTDVKILRTKDGRPRQLGFVGFRTSKEAKAALKYFNNTYIDTSKITVELAKPVGDKTLARPWSKYSKGSSAFEQKQGLLAAKQAAKPAAPTERKRKREHGDGELPKGLSHSDPAFREFLQTIKPTKLWANDDGGVGIGTSAVEKRGRIKKEMSGVTNGTTLFPKEKDKEVRVIKKKRLDEYGLAAPTKLIVEKTKVQSKKAGGAGVYYDRTHLKFEDLDDNEPLEEEQAGKGEEEEPIKDMPLQDGEMKKDEEEDAAENNEQSDDEDDDDEDDDASQQKQASSPSQHGRDSSNSSHNNNNNGLESEVANEDLIATTGRLFLRNLAFTTTEEDLYKLFHRYGDVSECHIPIDTDTRKPRGVAFVQFVAPHDALKAFSELDMTIFQGRLLHILPAKPRPSAGEGDTSRSATGLAGGKTFKKEREEQKRRVEAKAKQSAAWNPLYMRADTVAMSTASKLGVSKAELLDPTAATTPGATPAVRLALGEAAAVDETRQGLEHEGVSLNGLASLSSANGGPQQRSDTAMLVKNLPFGTREGELRLLFGRHGDIGRVVLLAAGGLAIVEFLDAVDARRAFAALAYKKFKHVPLYLEWAPIAVAAEAFDKAASMDADEPHDTTLAPIATTTDPEQKRLVKADLVAAIETDTAETTTADEAVLRTLYVKNINFSTSELAFRNLFERYGRVLAVTLPQRKSGNAGFGFVEMGGREDAVRAIKALQGAVLDGHALVVKFSEKSPDAAVQSKLHRARPTSSGGPGSGTGSSKLLVRNVPFEANLRELRELFGAFGQLKSLRIPKKFNGESRGYAFVDFLTKQEAASAFEALKDTHLYGRHLVIEYAKE